MVNSCRIGKTNTVLHRFLFANEFMKIHIYRLTIQPIGLKANFMFLTTVATEQPYFTIYCNKTAKY